MGAPGKRRFPSIIEEAISSKGEIALNTADTFRTDAAVILESLVAELPEDDVVNVMNRQGVAGEAYRPALRTLTRIAKQRRLMRLEGSSS